MVDFWPGRHGFHFSNNNIKWSFGPFSGKALCGGMVYAAMDYWFAGMQIPETTYVPAENTPLHSYIYNRQLYAHNNTLGKFFDAWQSGVLQDEESKKLANGLNAGRPLALCLFGGFKRGHHVVAFNYARQAKRICIYDPNNEDEMVMLTGEGPDVWRHSVSREAWKGFFVDDGYTYRKPVILEGDNGWLRCTDCRMLYSPDHGAVPCPKGGVHNPAGSPQFTLAGAQAGRGSNDWRKCKKCKALYYDKNSDSCLCAAGGLHIPTISVWFTLATDGEGQGNWRRCITCDGLFWLSGGGIGGICPGGGKHTSDMSAIYTVPFETSR